MIQRTSGESRLAEALEKLEKALGSKEIAQILSAAASIKPPKNTQHPPNLKELGPWSKFSRVA